MGGCSCAILLLYGPYMALHPKPGPIVDVDASLILAALWGDSDGIFEVGPFQRTGIAQSEVKHSRKDNSNSLLAGYTRTVAQVYSEES